MKISVRKQKDFVTSAWSGGTTTEFFLYPENGSYKERNFQVRISSAAVELEESTFTNLPGVTRFLMTLKGDLRVCHAGRYERLLAPFEVEQFSGDWETKSYGKAVDFNLMLKNGAEGEMEAILLGPGEKKELRIGQGEEPMLFVYGAESMLTVGETPLAPGEAAVATGEPGETVILANPGQKAARAAVCRVNLKAV